MGGKGSGQPIGCGMGRGKCGDCIELERRGTLGHWNYYCKITGRRVNRQPGCPKKNYVAPAQYGRKRKDYRLVRVENPRPGVRIDWMKVEVPC